LLEDALGLGVRANEHGHIIMSITGLALTGEQEIERLQAAGLPIGTSRPTLTSKNNKGYDKCHRLDNGRAYQVVIVPGKEVKNNQTIAEVEKYVAGFGYQKPLAGVVPRICEAVSSGMMEQMGFWYIAALHDPIIDSEGNPNVLYMHRCDDGQWVRAYYASPGVQWDDSGAFVFLAPAS